MKKIVSLFVFSFLFVASHATIRLPAVISSGMVLQQHSRATLWGWGDPGEKLMVTTSWNNAIDSLTVSSDGIWKMKVATPGAGGPYTITLKGWNTVVLDNILVGEVWFCSGQSNMEWSGHNNDQRSIDIWPKAINQNIRFFHVPRTTSPYPQDNCDASWQPCGPESVKWFSIVGFLFGNKLQHELNVPIGLIESAWGGTPVETFTPAPVIESDPIMKEAAAKLPVTPWGPSKPGMIYNGMIAPVTNFEIAGAIWYQGEANVGISASYNRTLTSMITAWHTAWQKNFPFYLVQIAPYKYGGKYEGALLMEQQAKTASSFPNTGMVVITDLVDNINDIHPKNKYDVALRLANLALAKTYQKTIAGYISPSYKSMEIAKNKIILSFDNAATGFMTKGNEKPTEFYIAGDDKVFQPADVKIEKDKIIVSSKLVPNPVAVRFGFSNTAMSNLFSKEGLPVTPFRTDSWDVN